MRNVFRFCFVALAMLAVVGCKEKKPNNVIIVRKPVIAKQGKPKSVGEGKKEQQVRWLGSSYRVIVEAKADKSLPLATDGSSKYYDNRIKLSIVRSDSTVFFERTLAKADFKPYVDNTYYKDGALLGIAFDKVEGHNIKFAASVGNPDMTSEEFVPLDITITNLGALSISKAKDDEAE